MNHDFKSHKSNDTIMLTSATIRSNLCQGISNLTAFRGQVHNYPLKPYNLPPFRLFSISFPRFPQLYVCRFPQAYSFINFFNCRMKSTAVLGTTFHCSPHPVKIDLNKMLDPKQKTIQTFNIHAQRFRKTKIENPFMWEIEVAS